jgi:hypothetical protein
MPTTGSRHLIEAVARQMRTATFAMLVQMLGMVGVMVYMAPPFAVPHRSAEMKPRPGSPVNKPEDAGAAARRAMPRPSQGPLVLRVEIASAFAVIVLLLTFVIPRLVVNSNRRHILAGTWTLRKGVGETSRSEPFTDEVLKHDTGKLAFVYVLQLGTKMCVTGFATFFAVFPYLFLGGSPIVLATVVLLIVATVLPFPTPSHLASWLDQQRELLAQERQHSLSTLHDAQLRARDRWGEQQQAVTGLQEPKNQRQRADSSGGVEAEVCDWLNEDAGANGGNRPANLSD